MKKGIYISIIAIFVGCRFHPKGDLPSFNLLLSDSNTVFNTKNIPAGKPSILIFFSPYCEHCQAETNDLLEKIDSFNKVNIYFITIDPMKEMKVFEGYYKLSIYPNITVGKDISYFFPAHFKGVIPPYSIVYDKYKQQRAVVKGQASAALLISIISKI